MSKKQEIKALIGQYRAAYVKAAAEVKTVKASEALTDQGKAEKLEEISRTYETLFREYKTQLEALLDQAQEEIRKGVQKQAARSLENADKALFVLKAIETGGITAENMKAVLPSFADDAISLGLFKKALAVSKDAQLNALSGEILEDSIGSGITALDKLKASVAQIPGVGSIGNGGFAQAFWNDGTSFDELAAYLDRAIV